MSTELTPIVTEQPIAIVLQNIRLLVRTGFESFQEDYRQPTRAEIKALRIGDEVLMWDAGQQAVEARIESRKRHRFVGRVFGVYPPEDRHRLKGKLIIFHACNILSVGAQIC